MSCSLYGVILTSQQQTKPADTNFPF